MAYLPMVYARSSTVGSTLANTCSIVTGMENAIFKAVCADFGSQAKTARFLGVTPALVSHVCTGLKPIPVTWCPKIEQATAGKYRCEQLRPDHDWSFLYLRAKASGEV